jgi:2-oxoglutarate dehydrogenase E1 component
MLLPHGFDGMGPEHSSARPERFLALASGGNLTICNVSTAAQYFHMLRRQGLSIERGSTCPLIVFTPKSLLRDKRAASPVADLAAERFQEVLVTGNGAKAKRVILCTGKVRHELLDARADLDNADDYLIVSLEQLYPLPMVQLRELLDDHKGAEWIWCQEEPRNMGAWSFALQRFIDQGRMLKYAGRPESSSPATGSHRRHSAEQAYLIAAAFQ